MCCEERLTLLVNKNSMIMNMYDSSWDRVNMLLNQCTSLKINHLCCNKTPAPGGGTVTAAVLCFRGAWMYFYSEGIHLHLHFS